jgi:polyisoprenoid-binding protein YceI
MRRLSLAMTAAAALFAAAPSRAADYKIDPSHTHILFMVNHLGFANMIGLFTDMSGTFSFDPTNVAASKVTVTIQTASLATQFTPRDNDLKGADWFNVTEFPEMTFVGTTYDKKDDHTGTLTGNPRSASNA